MTYTHHAQMVHALHDVCHNHTITPLHAIESGSRAWGFASFDSDFDVRLIYHHTPDWYLQIYDDKDTFEFINHDLFDVPFDIGGWDIKKALAHVYKSNAVIFEWLNSPMVYYCDDDFVQSLKKIQSNFFNPQAVYHHYQGMAKKANDNLDLTRPIRLKTWCYLIRALLASLWIKEYQTMSPVCMKEMFGLLTDDEIDELNHIIHLKQSHDEKYLYQLPIFMQTFTQYLWQTTQNITFNKKQKGDVEILNDLFRKIIFK